jgi:hypothetical protein
MIKLYATFFTVFLCVVLHAQVTSVASGDWNSGSTWSTGTVPTSSSQVIIASGHSVEVSSIGYAGSLSINAGGTLHVDSTTFNVTGSVTNAGSFTASAGGILIGGAAGTGLTNTGTISLSGGSFKLGPDGGGNTTLLNNGTLTVFWTDMWINGNLKSAAGSTFNLDNGHIRVDGNAGGNPANSVPPGTPIVEFSNSTGAALNLNGGILRIVDPHAASSSTSYALYVSIPEAVQVEPSSSFWLHFGDNYSTDAGGNANGFILNLHGGAANLALSNVMLNGPAGVNRILSSVHPLVITRDIIVQMYMEFRPGVDVYLGRDLNIIGTATLDKKIYFTRHNLVTGVSTPVTVDQNVAGTIQNAVSSPTANFNRVVINSQRVLFLATYSVADTLSLQSGILGAGTVTLGLDPTHTGVLVHGTGTVEGDLRRFVAPSTGSYLYPVFGNKMTVNLTTAPTMGGTITVGIIHEARRLTNGLPLFEGSMLIDTAAASQGVYPGVFKVSSGTGLVGGVYDLTYEWKPFDVNTNPSKLVLLYRPSDAQHWSLQGTHVTTTGSSTAPVLSRTGISVYGTFGIGKSTIDIGPTTVQSVTSGNWSNPATWNTGVVPTSASQVIIRNGDSVVLSSSAQANNIIINADAILNFTAGTLSVASNMLNGGTLHHAGGNINISGTAATGYSNNNSGIYNLSSGTFRVGPENGGNRTFLNTGTVNVSGGTLEINGNLSNTLFAPFAQTAGNIIVDGNAGGDITNSVAGGTPIVDFQHYLSFPSGINLSGGMFTIVDPHPSPVASSALNASLADNILSTGTHTFRLGNGTSTDPGGSNVGFRINDSYRLYEILKLANVVIEGSPAGINRFVTTNFNLHITGDFIINTGGEYRVTTIGSSSTYPTTRVSGNFTVNTGSTATLPGRLILGPSTGNQGFNINGTIQNAVVAPTANVAILEIDNSNKVTSVNAPLSVSQSLVLSGGVLDMGIHTLTLGTSPAQTGTIPSAAGRIVGKFRRYIAAAPGSYSFPVGTLTRSRLSNINFTTAPATGGTITTEWISNYGGTNGLPLSQGTLVVDSTSRSGYWSVVAGGGLTGGTYTGTFTPDDIVGYTDISKLVLLKRNDASSVWTLQGTHVPTSGSLSVPVLQRTGMTGFSEFGVGISSGNTVLPVTLVSFTGRVNADATIKLQWTVAQQQGIDRYIVERSANGTEFNSIGTVTANSLRDYNYTFTDAAPLNGKNYYRLKIMEAGRSRYSDVVELSTRVKSLLSVYPVPAKDVITLERGNSDISDATISDMQGRVVMRLRLVQQKQQVNIRSLLPGMYILRSGDESVTIIK